MHNGFSDARIRAFFLSAFVEKANISPQSVSSVLRKSGIAPAAINFPYRWVALGDYIVLTELLAEISGNPNLGLETGQNFSGADLGPFYALTLTARTVGAMIDAYIRFQLYWQTCSRLELQFDGDRAEIRYRICDPKLWPRRQDTEFTLASITMAIQHATMRNWRPTAILLEHDISGREKELFDVFRCYTVGNQEHNAIVFLTSALDMPLPGNADLHSEKMHSVTERHLLDLMRSDDGEMLDLVESIRRLISERFGEGSLQLGALATELGMSERTLRRHLAQRKTSFRDLLQEERMRRARQLLASRSKIPLIRLADQLGYADSASFARAFKSWTGSSPRRYSRVFI